ncbi:MAG: DEAD/DEAH box helicase, partial [Candidatus Bathyarchaeota archaeon]|nr:DEAD/DEAH box helicase [Candidatus Bathyarchaeota archaeon]
SSTPNDKQVSLFSATLNRSVMQICKDFMHYPEKVIVSKDEIALPQIEQHYVEVESNSKFRALVSILEEFRIERAIIFSRTQDSATGIAQALIARGYDADALHGGLSQLQRDRITEFFREGKLRLLIATDIASRGLDIRDVTHIINFNIPTDPAVYFHRIGRTARMEAGGTAISLASSEELKDLDRIRGMTSTQITMLQGKHDNIVEAFREPRPKCAKCGNEFTPTFTLTEGVFVYCPKCYKNHQKKRRQNRQLDAN